MTTDNPLESSFGKLLIFVAVEEAKERWKSQRDKYVRPKKKQKTPQVSGAARVERAKWPLMETMSFLDRFIQPRRSISVFLVRLN